MELRLRIMRKGLRQEDIGARVKSQEVMIKETIIAVEDDKLQ